MSESVRPSALAVGSANAAKCAAVRDAAAALLPGCEVASVAVDSGVARQPLGMAAVRQGAVARALAAAAGRPGAWGVGLESGLARRGGRLHAVGWCAVADGRRVLGAASTPEFVLPPGLAAAARQALTAGGTLAEATASRFGGRAEEWAERGTVWAVTAGRLSRTDLWRAPALLALGAACLAADERPRSPQRRRP